MKTSILGALQLIAVLAATSTLVACGSDSRSSTPPPPPSALEPGPSLEYEVNVVNLTAGQPLSPVAVFIHDDSQRAFTVGSPASEALEQMAEGGDNSALLEAMESMAEISGDTPLGPGASTSFNLEINGDDASGLELTVITMLVNTNDAFTAVNASAIAALEVGDSWSFRTPSYDSGTEANSESAGTIPGPADGGEGFNALRDDVADQVTMHGGVVTSADGLAGSVLGQQHRWDNPVTQISISRIR